MTLFAIQNSRDLSRTNKKEQYYFSCSVAAAAFKPLLIKRDMVKDGAVL